MILLKGLFYKDFGHSVTNGQFPKHGTGTRYTSTTNQPTDEVPRYFFVLFDSDGYGYIWIVIHTAPCDECTGTGTSPAFYQYPTWFIVQLVRLPGGGRVGIRPRSSQWIMKCPESFKSIVVVED
jgi:hypothetical protein